MRLWVDSSAAKSMASRIGLGRVRHMEVKYLWLQEAVNDKRIMVKKILGTRNPADVLTKPKACHEVAELLKGVGVHIESRRPQPVRYASTEPKPVESLSTTAPEARNEMPEKTPVTKPTTTLPTNKPLMPEKPDQTTMKPGMTKMPHGRHTTTQRITPGGGGSEEKREIVSMRECGPMQRGRPCAAESDVRRCHVHLHRGAISKVRWAVVPGHSWGSGLNEKSPHVCSPSGATCRRASGVGWSASTTTA